MRLIFMVAIGTVAASPAYAVIPVIDDALTAINSSQLVKEGITAVETANTALSTANTVLNTAGILNSIAHGNIYAIGALLPQLSALGLTMPLPAQPTQLMQLVSGVGGVTSRAGAMAGLDLGLFGQIGSLATGLMGQTTVYRPPGTDPLAMAMQARATGTAGTLALTQQSLTATQARLTGIDALRTAAGTTRDTKDAADMTNRLLAEQAVNSAQANQLFATEMARRAQQDADAGRAEQQERQGWDTLVTNAKAAADKARGGVVAAL